MAAFRVMLLNLIRDRGALASAFVLPATVFVIFAVIFAGTTGGTINLKVAVADERGTDASQQLVAAIFESVSLTRMRPDDDLAAMDVRELVRTGAADVGLIIRDEGGPLDNPIEGTAAPLQIIVDPAREIAVSIFEGALNEAYFAAFPRAPLRSAAEELARTVLQLTETQTRELDARIDAAPVPAEGDGQGFRMQPGMEKIAVAGTVGVASGVSYYAGAVAILFLLYSSVIGALSLLEEKESGLFDRLTYGPGGTRALVEGKFAFLVAQGIVQVTIIFLVAWLGFGVDLPGHILPWAGTTVVSALAAAGLALVFVLLCRSKQQAQTLTNIVVLLVSAIGGSMVPRFLMPQWIQDIGWLTPNTWAVEAYNEIFWRASGLDAMVLPWVVLGATGLVTLLAANLLAHRHAG
jgi:ABC-2 type transport system permease protein